MYLEGLRPAVHRCQVNQQHLPAFFRAKNFFFELLMKEKKKNKKKDKKNQVRNRQDGKSTPIE